MIIILYNAYRAVKLLARPADRRNNTCTTCVCISFIVYYAYSKDIVVYVSLLCFGREKLIYNMKYSK